MSSGQLGQDIKQRTYAYCTMMVPYQISVTFPGAFHVNAMPKKYLSILRNCTPKTETHAKDLRHSSHKTQPQSYFLLERSKYTLSFCAFSEEQMPFFSWPPMQSFLGESYGEEGNTSPLKSTAWEAIFLHISATFSSTRFTLSLLSLPLPPPPSPPPPYNTILIESGRLEEGQNFLISLYQMPIPTFKICCAV